MISSFDHHSTPRKVLPEIRPGLEAQEGLNDEQSRPLVTVTAALYELADFDLDADRIRGLIESGKLIAFDIAAGRRKARRKSVRTLIRRRGGAAVTDENFSGRTAVRRRRGARRLVVRILSRSLEFFRANGGRKYHELEWAEIFRLLVPHQRPVVTGPEICQALLCDRGHVKHLIYAGELAPVEKSKRGPGGSWKISRASFEQFLQNRRQ